MSGTAARGPGVVSCDVLVAGGGPAGAAAAIHLARRGHDVLLCDAARFPRHKICGEYLQPAAYADLERLGAAGAIEALHPLRPAGMAVVSRDGTKALGRFGASASSPPGPARGGPTSLSLQRYHFDAALLRVARDAGVAVRQGERVDGFRRARDGAFTIALSSGQVRARAIVGADGRNSLVARRLGMRLGPGRHRRWAVMGHYRGVRTPEDHGEMIATSYGYCGLNPLPEGLCNVCLVFDPGRAGGRLPGRAQLASFFAAALEKEPLTRVRMEGSSRVGPLRATGPLACRTKSIVADGAVLVGDAAGFFDPFTGEGIHVALKSGEMAAEVLSEALRRGDLGVRSLRPYASRHAAAFDGRRRLDRVLQALLRSPTLTDWAVRKLARDPGLADILARVAGDLTGAAELVKPGFVARLILA